MNKDNKGEMVDGLFWMYTISMFVFWVPVLGGLAAGLIGGRFAGGVKRALTASIIPAVIFGVILTLLALTFQIQWLSLTHATLSPGMLVSSYVLFLMIGATLGGLREQVHRI